MIVYADRMDGLIVAAAGVVVEDLDEDVCLYRPDIDEVLVLNQSAGDVWRLVDGTLSVAGLVTQLARAYGLEAATIEADVREVVNDLCARGFLVEQSGVEQSGTAEP